MKDKPVLLLVLGVLLLARFILVPIFDWQEETLTSTQHLQKKLNKSKAYLDDLPALQAHKEALEQALTVRRAESELFNDVNRYQIAKQRQFEAIFEQNQIVITSSNWLEPIPTEKGVIVLLRLKFHGKVKSFLASHLQLSGVSKSISITNLSLSISGQGSDSLGNVNGNVIIRFNALESANAANE